MIVLRFPTPTHFRVRALEWFFGAVTVTMGVVLLNPYPTLDAPVFQFMLAFAPESVWQYIILGLGVARVAALYVNGAWAPSPWFRLATALACAIVWAWISLGCAQSGNAYLLLAIFPWACAADLYNVGRAAKDARMSRDALAQLPEAPANPL